MKHFAYYPKIEYSNEVVVNIMCRAKIRDAILEQSAIYYKYTVTDNDRPDILATKYYGNPTYTWAIFYANNIRHPILDWPLGENAFEAYLESKYGSVESIQSLQNIPHHYEFTEIPGTGLTYIIDEETYNKYLADDLTKEYARKVTVYDHEYRLNDAKRDILILDKQYILQITNELKNVFK